MKIKGSVLFVLGDQRFTGEELAMYARKYERVSVQPGVEYPDLKVMMVLLAQYIPLVLYATDGRLELNLRLARFQYTIVTTEKRKEVHRTGLHEDYTLEASMISTSLFGFRIDTDLRVAVNRFEVTIQPFALDATFCNGSPRFILREHQPGPVTALPPPTGFKEIQTIRMEDSFD